MAQRVHGAAPTLVVSWQAIRSISGLCQVGWGALQLTHSHDMLLWRVFCKRALISSSHPLANTDNWICQTELKIVSNGLCIKSCMWGVGFPFLDSQEWVLFFLWVSVGKQRIKGNWWERKFGTDLTAFPSHKTCFWPRTWTWQARKFGVHNLTAISSQSSATR